MMAEPTSTPPDGGDCHLAAHYYASLGWRVLPIIPGAKSPPIPQWQNAATTDPDTITAWWTGLYRNYGVGIATGRASGIFVLDVDVSGDKAGDETLAELERTYSPLPDTVEAVTGSDGRHLLFRYPDGVAIRNNAGTKLGPGLDVRGDGGQIVAAPTVHPNGRPYMWLIGHAPDEREVADAPGWLVHLLTADNRPERTERRERIAPAPDDLLASGDDSIAERINRDHDWHEVLLADGWKRHHTDRTTGDTHWTRPGKEERDGASAVLHEPDGPFVVFSTDPGLRALQRPEATTANGDGWAWSLFGYLAATRYDGDRSACARDYRQKATRQAATDATYSTARIAHATLTEAHGGESGDDEDPLHDWGRQPLGGVLGELRNGTRQRITPTIMDVRDSSPLFYAGRINQVFGESGSGKTWITAQAMLEAIRRGESVLMIDYEDHADGIAERLMLLGVTDDEVERIDYRNPATGLGIGVADHLHDVDPDTTVVVIDSTGEAMSAAGTNSYDDGEVAAWFRTVKALGRICPSAAIIAIDHIPKATDSPSSYAIGSQRKRAAVTGAAYRVDTIKEPARGRSGVLKLTVAKDRFGTRPKGSVACHVDVIADDDSVRLDAHLSDAQVAAATGEKFRPTHLMERVSRWLENNPRATGRQVEQAVSGKATAVRTALSVLVEEGYVAVDKVASAHLYVVRTAYREDGDEGPRPRVPPRPDRVPDALGGSVGDRVPASPPLRGDAGRGQLPGGLDGPRPDRVPRPGDALDADRVPEAGRGPNDRPTPVDNSTPDDPPHPPIISPFD